MRRFFAAGALLVLAYAFGILCIGLTRDWELLHEDNGALHTTFALSHLRLGLARTRAHDYFFEPRTGLEGRYGAHPPGPGLVLAAAFAVAGSDTPAVARLVAIGFQLGTIVCMVLLLRRLFDVGTALAGGVLMATLPMGAFFGRMVNYEPLCLFAVLLQLTGYVLWRQGAARRGLLVIVAGIVLGGLIDWPAFLFAAAIIVAVAADATQKQPTERAGAGPRRDGPPQLSPSRVTPVVVLAASAGAIFVIDVGHLWFVGSGSVRSLRLFDQVLAGAWLAQWGAMHPVAFVVGQLESARRYYTDAGLVSAILVAAALLVFRWPPAAFLLGDAGDRLLHRRLLAISGGAALAYVLAAPTWARIHAYWQFYALPFVVLAMLLVGRALLRLAWERGSLLARALLAIFVVDTVIGSASTLYFRHTTRSAHTVRQVAELRANAMVPAYLGERRAPR